MTVNATAKIARNYLNYRMKKLFKNNGIIMANLYLELDQQEASTIDIQNSKVEVFGEFSKPNIWQVRVTCTYDPYFKCHKSEVVQI